ncbi:MAG: hypothetical protein HETSPECPRED_003745 [Heterodermia speciosa]|uniref:Molybdopterin synthase sulfur carrier subunit n=1 Tax=Heterodermia speciosa TaxID=116794 RepID=A0A8H3F969_9LECA|nr:MAG: hypothetical protein HETSPECPRED_003745 [Heterodermia speciosa]
MPEKTPPGHFHILYFASASTFIGKTAETFPAPINLEDLYDYLEGKYPGIKEKVLNSCAVTLNLHYVDLQDVGAHDRESFPRIVKEGDEVGIIPPVSSG